MPKVTIGVYKAYKNSGNLHFHKRNTKKHWKHYFIEIDDYDEEEYSFGSEWVSSLRAVFLKKKQLYKKQFICEECACKSFLSISDTLIEKASIGINKTNAIAIIITSFTNFLFNSIILVVILYFFPN